MPNSPTTSDNIDLSDRPFLSETLPESEPLLTKALPQRKHGDGDGWNEAENLITPREAQERLRRGANYGFALGYGTERWKLVAFDVESQGVLPPEAKALIDKHALIVWDSVHSGRNRLLKVTPDAYEVLDTLQQSHDHLSDNSDDDIEIQTSGHCIGPGCDIAHQYCSDTKSGCPGTGTDSYEVVRVDSSVPPVTKEVVHRTAEALEIDSAERRESADSEKEEIGEVPDYDDTQITAAEKHLKTLQANHSTAFRCLSDRLNGGTGNKDDLCLETGQIDRSKADFVTLSDLYGVMYVLGNEDEHRAKQLAYSYYTHRCKGNRYTKVAGRIRKWLARGEAYRRNRLDHGVCQFDRGRFQRWLNQRSTSGDLPWLSQMDGYYSETTRNYTRFALSLLSGEVALDADLVEFHAVESFRIDVDGEAVVEAVRAVLDGALHHPLLKDEDPPSGENHRASSLREYPTKSEVARLAERLDQERGNKVKTYKDALGAIKREGGVKMARCPNRPNGERTVYYPRHLPDPDDAKTVELDNGTGTAKSTNKEETINAGWD